MERRTGPRSVGALLYDLDADGFDDAVYPCQLGESIELYWGNTAGTLGTPLSLASGRVSPHMAFGDVDENGHQDMLVALQGEGPPFTDRIRIFFGGGMRTFPRQSDIMFDGNPRAMVLTDLDADGHLDLLMDRPGAADACMVLLPGNGRGLFDTVDPLCVWSIPASPDDGANIVVVARDPGVTHFARVVSEAVWRLDITDAGVVVSAARQVVPGVERAAHLTVLEADGDESPDLIVASVPMATSGPVVIQRSTTPAASCDYDSGFYRTRTVSRSGLPAPVTSTATGLIDLSVGRWLLLRATHQHPRPVHSAMARPSLRLAVLALTHLLLQPSLAAAQPATPVPDGVRLVYAAEGVPGCPDEAELRSLVASRIGGVPYVADGAWEVRVTVRATGYALEAQVSPGPRRLKSAERTRSAPRATARRS
ncbi:MAG: VCBS repeat-containing protein [Sandaracinaceae bacterium]|nr:VCBS repeat-containing protein [Sandaracinaceae bacterium]